MVPVLYTIGLFLLPRQFNQERAYRHGSPLSSGTQTVDEEAQARNDEYQAVRNVSPELGQHKDNRPIDPDADDVPLTPTRSTSLHSQRSHTSSRRLPRPFNSMRKAVPGASPALVPVGEESMQERGGGATLATRRRLDVDNA